MHNATEAAVMVVYSDAVALAGSSSGVHGLEGALVRTWTNLKLQGYSYEVGAVPFFAEDEQNFLLVLAHNLMSKMIGTKNTTKRTADAPDEAYYRRRFRQLVHFLHYRPTYNYNLLDIHCVEIQILEERLSL